MNITVVDVFPSYTVVEYNDHDGLVQRRMVPQGLHGLHKRGPASVPDEVVAMSMEYSTVDLVAVLGNEFPAIRVRDLQDQLRRAGLWTQKDYLEHPDAISGVWQRMRGADTTLILNAAHQLHLDDRR